ncbi:MAG: cytochrome C biogenesis protein [Planctomycetota bacterium]|nr:MAG: cytochrome C biogenesis protein [Planctomycetota bacterium]
MSVGSWFTVSGDSTSGAAAWTPYRILKLLGSLKITVTMFALAMFLVLFGTLAQDEMDLPTVKREFFTCWVASVPFDILFPVTLFPHDEPYLGGLGFYFPGGATIGLVLLVNLIAAKVTRFSVQAKGMRLYGGVAVSLLGAGLIAAVIMGGHATDGLQGQPPISYDTLWRLLQGGLVVATLLLIGYLFVAKIPNLARGVVATGAVVAFLLSAVVLGGGSAVRLDDSGLRIVWQLVQASVASWITLAGLWMIFGSRGGNVLIHIGVGLLMVGQFVFGDRQIEQRINLAEGSSTNLAVIEDEVEIALIDTSDPKEDVVYAIPESLIRKYAGRDEPIDAPELPVKVRILQWMRNSTLEPASADDENPATAGLGMQMVAKPLKPYGGAIMDKVNLAAAYIELIDKQTGESLGTFLLSQERNDLSQLTGGMQPDTYERVEINGKPFDLAIRFRQERKPYDVYLKDVQRRNYTGTDTARDYSSRIVITDRASGESQEGKTWMNNPLRYRGETFYQSRYNRVPDKQGGVIETTGLQVVKNAGWVIPYVACMMALWGMAAHFGVTFMRFSQRYSRGAVKGALLKPAPMHWGRRIGVAVAALAVCGATAGHFARPPAIDPGRINVVLLDKLPVQHEGRIKPFNTVARNVLQVISKPVFGMVSSVKVPARAVADASTAAGDNGEQAGDTELIARTPSEWLLGVMGHAPWVRQAQVFRIYAPEVRSFLDLEKRRGYRYAYAEIEPKLDAFRAKINELRGKDRDSLSFVEKKMAELHSQLNLFDLIWLAYQEPPFPSAANLETDEQREQFFARIMQIFEVMQQLEAGGPPALIPPVGKATAETLADAKWQAYGPAQFARVLSPLLGVQQTEENPLIDRLALVLDAARQDDPQKINAALEAYYAELQRNPFAQASMSRAATESWLNRFNPTAQGVALYVLAILLGFSSFLVRIDDLRRGTFWLLVGVFVIHTIAIVARIYVSGRAPVINLYSSAVFIGWACVLFGLAMELIYPMGIANLVAALTGAVTLSVARFLDTSDTMPVLQAVLDTQFWLSTHVITISLGYATTFFAGFLGICALVHRMVSGYDQLAPDERLAAMETVQSALYRMTYGVVCFALFFSFIGTVLGGLWADDSWGRFWGWDPKENGALMIVLWNALLLHSRWDRQVGPRGFAVLAVLGNIVTAWSWFGTNQLGIGLHSYGFTSGALWGLIGFVAVNFLFVVVSLFVTNWQAAQRESDAAAAAA